MDSPPVIPDHTLLRPIGRGSYGEVWLARNIMGAWRAVKLIWRRQFESQRPYEREFDGIRRFEPVSRSSGGLVHVLHVGHNEAEGCFYYVMELADAEGERAGRWESGRMGSPTPVAIPPAEVPAFSPADYSPRTLRSDLKRLGRIPTANCLRLALDVTSGLAQLHRHGLVHRDVKPGNIIYVNGRAKLADIGLVSGGGEGRTFVGTEGYIPPEGPGAPAADLYALGIVLYEASTGHSPEKFPDVPAEWLADEMGNEALELHEIILKACEGQRERRYESAESMQADLALLQSGQSIRRVRALERRNARLRAAGVLGTTFLVLAVGAALFANHRARVEAESRANEIALREQAETALARAEAAERESQQQLYGALLEQARATVLTRELGQRIRALEAVRRAGAISNSTELRGVAIAALALPDLHFEREMQVAPGITGLEFDPALERIALCWSNGPVEIRSVPDDGLLGALPASTNLPAYGAQWSADGRFLAVLRDRDPAGRAKDIEIWEADAIKRVLLLHDVPWGAVAFHPRLPRVMAGQAPASVVTWDLETSQELVRHPIEGQPIVLKLAPAGDAFAASYAADGEWRVGIHDAATGELRASRSFTRHVTMLDWHPSGRWIGVPVHSGAVHLMDADTGAARLLGRHKANAVTAKFSPNGRYLFTGGWERELICWDVKTMQRAFTVRASAYRFQFGADGRRCAILHWEEPRLQFCVFEEPVLHREFAEDLGGHRNFAAFSSDGQWLAAAGGERLVVWSLSGEGPGAAMEVPPETRLSFAANGELFVNPRGDGSRWSVAPGGDATPPKLERLELSKPAGLLSFCLLSNGIVFTGARGSSLAGSNPIDSNASRWAQTIEGLNGASYDERWLALFRPYTPHLDIHRLPGLEPVARLTNAANVTRFEFSPVGDEVAVCTRGGVEFWSLQTWQRTRHLTRFTDIQYAPDARSFWLSTQYRTAGLYEARTVELILPLPPNTLPLTLSPDGRHLAASVDQRHVQVWDLAEVRRQLRELGLDWRD